MSKNKSNFLKNWGLIYWNVLFYRITMAALRPRGRRRLYERLAQHIGTLSTLELCCGEGELRQWIRAARYQGIDQNPMFTRHLSSQGIPVLEGDILTIPWPSMECLVIVDSLYHFIPNIDSLMKKMMSRGFRKIIIAESVEHWAHSRWSWMVRFSIWGTRVAGQSHPYRFSETEIQSLFQRYGFQNVERIGSNLTGVCERP